MQDNKQVAIQKSLDVDWFPPGPMPAETCQTSKMKRFMDIAND